MTELSVLDVSNFAQEVFGALNEINAPVGVKSLAEYAGLPVLDVSKAAHLLLMDGLVTKDRGAKYSVTKNNRKIKE